MKAAVRQTRSYLMELFEKRGIKPRTHMGQNFLIDLNILEFIVEQAELGRDDVVLEVGAGTGGLTGFLAQHAAAVISVELDPQLYQLAEESIRATNNTNLLNCDALKTKNRFSPQLLDAVRSELPGRKLKLISNLPYNIATPVIANLAATDLEWERMVVTIQWELGLRVTARPRQSHYGALSVWLQAQCDAKLLKQLPMTVFWPRPKVHSAIIRLSFNRKKQERINDRSFFHDFVRRAFQHRRKFFRSVLANMYRQQLRKPQVDGILEDLRVAPNSRSEQLSVSTFIELSNRICDAIRHTN